MAAVAAAADPACFADQIAAGLTPHQVKKLYFTALPKRFFAALADSLSAAGIDVNKLAGPRVGDLREWGYPDELVTTAIDVSRTLEQKRQSFLCHRTQLDPEGPFAMALKLGGETWRGPMSTEYFQRVLPPVVPGEPQETDLFAGLE